MVLAEGKIQPEELYTLSRPHPRPRPASRQGDSRTAYLLLPPAPQPSLCTTRDDNSADKFFSSASQARTLATKSHTARRLSRIWPCPECSSGSCAFWVCRVQALKHTVLSHPFLKACLLISPHPSTCHKTQCSSRVLLKGQFPIFPAGEPVSCELLQGTFPFIGTTSCAVQ